MKKGQNKTGNIDFTHSCISTDVSIANYISGNAGMGEVDIPSLVSVLFSSLLLLFITSNTFSEVLEP